MLHFLVAIIEKEGPRLGEHTVTVTITVTVTVTVTVTFTVTVTGYLI
jgi:hypothetical protein